MLPRGHTLPSCPLSNTLETATRTWRIAQNQKTGQTDGRTDGRTDRSIALCRPPTVGRGHNSEHSLTTAVVELEKAVPDVGALFDGDCERRWNSGSVEVKCK